MKHRSKMLQSSRRLEAVTTINMTPLIDLAFALLIIFIIATPLLEQTIPLNLPLEDSDAAEPDKDIEFQTISIDKNGQVFWGKTPVDKEGLQSRLEKFSQHPNPPVLNIRGEASLPYQAIIDVVDMVKKNNLEKISLDTQVK